MNNKLYVNLAFNNIKKNGKTYFPYILACTGSIIMFYILHFIALNDGLNEMPGGSALKIILNLGICVIGFFSVIFLFYTNSFLIKRRKKELGLYNILGMEKKHIARVLFLETFFVALISIVVGLLGGILISKLMFLVLLKILNFDVPMGFSISTQSLIITIILFGIIFILTLLNNLREIHLSKPIELLNGGQVGEKEPKTKWILALIGTISLSSGYYIALTTESPLDAMTLFFLAVILVMIGTYALFTAGSIVILKILRKNKKFYYRTNNFINVSGMIYRMKQNAVGLANICILSTSVLVMLSTTVSLYIGMDDLLQTRYPRDIAIKVNNVSNEDSEMLDNIILEQTDKLDISINNIVKYRYIPFVATQDKNSFISKDSDSSSYNDICKLNIIPLNEYNSLENKSITLADNEVLVFTFRGELKDNAIDIFGNEFIIKEHLDNLPIDGMSSAMAINTYYIVVPNVQTVENFYNSNVENLDNTMNFSYYYAFDTEGEAENEISLVQTINDTINEASITGYAEGVEDSREIFYSVYGGLFFLGIFLAALFLMATVLIIYYKQISEGYDDKERFEVMQKVGLSKKEVKVSIRSQVLMIFFIPLIMSVIHIAFAFKVIYKILNLMNLSNIKLFTFCTLGSILVFAIFYGIVYSLTAKLYYKIVSQ